MLNKTTIKSLVLFLLLSQLVTVVHALEHELTHKGNDQCFICIHNADLNNALSNSVLMIENTPPAFERIQSQSQDIYLTTFSILKNRSPPASLL